MDQGVQHRKPGMLVATLGVTLHVILHNMLLLLYLDASVETLRVALLVLVYMLPQVLLHYTTRHSTVAHQGCQPRCRPSSLLIRSYVMCTGYAVYADA